MIRDVPTAKYVDSTSVTSQDGLSGAALTSASQVPWLKTRRIRDILQTTDDWLWISSHSVLTMEPRPVFGARWTLLTNQAVSKEWQKWL